MSLAVRLGISRSYHTRTNKSTKKCFRDVGSAQAGAGLPVAIGEAIQQRDKASTRRKKLQAALKSRSYNNTVASRAGRENESATKSLAVRKIAEKDSAVAVQVRKRELTIL